MKTKVFNAKGAALDWLVATADGRRMGFNLGGGLEVRGRTESGKELPEQWDMWMPWHPSTDWSQGGPIIEREGINVSIQNDTPGFTYSGKARWWAQMDCRVHTAYGPTPLIAAMRCLCCAKLGDEIDIPEGLCQQQNN